MLSALAGTFDGGKMGKGSELIPQYMRRAWQIGSSAALRQFESALKDL